jgi:hypothetical protein
LLKLPEYFFSLQKADIEEVVVTDRFSRSMFSSVFSTKDDEERVFPGILLLRYVGVSVTFKTFIREMLGSNLGPDTGYTY